MRGGNSRGVKQQSIFPAAGKGYWEQAVPHKAPRKGAGREMIT